MADMMEIMKADPKLKVVLKEFPVLSPGSVEAAQVCGRRANAGSDRQEIFDFHQKLLGGRGAADKARAMAVAKEVGLDMASWKRISQAPKCATRSRRTSSWPKPWA